LAHSTHRVRQHAINPSRASNQQQQQRQQRQRQQGSQSRQTAQSQQQQQQSISGTLIDARSIQLRGQQDRHLLAKIQTDQGRTVVADLGPQHNLRNFQPTRGSEIEVSGTRGTINGRPVILADRASAGDQSVSIQRSGSQDARQTRQSQQSQQQRRQQQQQQQQSPADGAAPAGSAGRRAGPARQYRGDGLRRSVADVRPRHARDPEWPAGSR
jgi:hypothetical protein